MVSMMCVIAITVIAYSRYDELFTRRFKRPLCKLHTFHIREYREITDPVAVDVRFCQRTK